MDTFLKMLVCLGKPWFSRPSTAIPVNTAGSDSLHPATFLGVVEMRLGWVKFPGISIFFLTAGSSPWNICPAGKDHGAHEIHFYISWPLEPAPSPTYKSQVIPICGHFPSPVSCSGTHPSCPLFVIFGRTLPPWQQLCQTDWHTPITLEQMPQSFCHY